MFNKEIKYKSCKDLLILIGYDELYKIFKGIPEGATHYYCDVNDDIDTYLKDIKYQVFFDTHYVYKSHTGYKWIKIEYYNLEWVEHVYDISDIETYIKAWMNIKMHGGIYESKDAVERAYVYDKAYFALKDAIKLYHDVGRDYDFETDDDE